jgi:hypothetical protein
LTIKGSAPPDAGVSNPGNHASGATLAQWAGERAYLVRIHHDKMVDCAITVESTAE